MEVDRGDVLRLMGALRECSRYVERGVAEHPLDAIDAGILALAEEADGALRPSQAAERLEVAFPSITRHVRALQQAGRVAIDPDAGDRRGYRILVTEAGGAMLSDFRDGLVSRFAPVLEGWRTAEVQALTDGLVRLNNAMARENERRRPGRSASSWWRASAEHTARAEE